MMTLLPLYLLLLLMPLGVAGQNIGTGVVALPLFWLMYTRRGELPLSRLWREHKLTILATLAFIAMQVVSTFANPASPNRFSINYIFGHLIWCLLPPFIFLAEPRLSERDWDRLFLVFAFVAALMGLASASQAIWGWRVVGVHFERGFTRAQGLYSHPMTFAYVCLVLWPFACYAAGRWPRRAASWVTVLGIGVAILCSRSRTVEVVAALTVLVNLWGFTRGRLRYGLLGACVVCGLAVLLTHNPVSERFRGTLERHDVRSDYPDDRVAFWDANSRMVLERPLLGHGEGLNTKYRHPYYAAIGLGDFERQYEAHDMFLQVVVNVGLVGLAIFLTWLGSLFRFSWRQPPGDPVRHVGIQTLAAFCLAALTQNAFQDAAVRFTLTLVIAALWLAARDRDEGRAL